MNTSTTGYYSVIQYCPHRGRMEAANIGVLLFRPDPKCLRVRLAEGNERITRFFGAVAGDLKQIDAMKVMLEHRITAEMPGINNVDGLSRFTEMMANEIMITEPRVMLVEDVETDLQELFDELVADPEEITPPKKS